MKVNSKILGVLLALLAIAMVISAASAVDLVKDFKNENFSIDVPSGSNFKEGAVTDINSGDVAMKMIVFENSANSSDDAGTIIYLKDTSADKKLASDFINDLRKDCEIVEETDKYVVVKTQNSNNISIDVANDLDGILNFAQGLFNGGGFNFSSEGNSVSLSGNGLEISDDNGENVSISSEGVKVSGNASDEDSDDVNVSLDDNIDSNIKNGDYTVCLKNKAGNQVMTITGNNLEVLKAMADTASFKGN